MIRQALIHTGASPLQDKSSQLKISFEKEIPYLSVSITNILHDVSNNQRMFCLFGGVSATCASDDLSGPGNLFGRSDWVTAQVAFIEHCWSVRNRNPRVS